MERSLEPGDQTTRGPLVATIDLPAFLVPFLSKSLPSRRMTRDGLAGDT